MTEERFLVTGALGCVGAWTVKRLVDEGAQVWAYDLGGSRHRLELVLTPDEIERVAFIRGDIADTEAFERAIVDHGISHIVHLAALQVPFVRADPVAGARVNVVGTTVVFDTIKKHAEQIRGFAYASSVGVYGRAEDYPSGPLAHGAAHLPSNLYGVFKSANEGTARIFWEENGVASIGIRPYVVYGPGRDQGWTSTPTKAMLAALLGRKFRITFGGKLVYHHADDAAAVMLKAARTRLDGAPVFNLGGSTAHMDEIVAAITAVIPESSGSITFEPQPLPHPPEMDDSELERALGPISWRRLEDGVRDTVEVFRRAIDNGRFDVERAVQV